MPLSTIIIVFGSWLVLLALVVIYYFKTRNEEEGK